MNELLLLLENARIYDLAHPYFVGMPHHPSHPPFLFSLTKLHGDSVMPNGGSSASDALTMGGHLGTHIDALCHFSCQGKLHNGQPVTQSYGGGVERLSAETIAPILRRGVLLDIAGQEKKETLHADFEITASHLDSVTRSQGVDVRPGDVVLMRTGWAHFFDDPPRFINQFKGPGVGKAGAHWLSEHKVFAAGSDTLAFEKVPSDEMPVHVHLLVESGIHIIECLNLEQLAAERIYEFMFAAMPLKIRGATGAPMRPVAIRV